MKKAILLIALFCLSCNVKEEFKTVTIANKYSIDIPNSFEKVGNLNDEASLQYQNALKEFYVIVIDESKESFNKAIFENQSDITPDLEGYYKAIQFNLTEAIKDKKLFEEKTTSINGRKAKVFSVTGNVEGYDIFYRYAIIEGKSNYYQIMLWTEKKKETNYKEMMNRSINSFKELNQHDKLYKE
jgi:hypothetical protein